MKFCSKCNEEKSLEDFHKGEGLGGRRADCKSCVNSRMKRNYNKDSKSKAWYNDCQCGSKKSRYSERCRTCARPEYNPDNPNWITNTRGYRQANTPEGVILEHRWVMEREIGRKLFTHEAVHHKNGDRADNRLTNLELWSSAQPSGQRIEDKVAWAREIIALYG